MTDLVTDFKLIQQEAKTEPRIETPEKAAQITGLPTNRIGIIRLQLDRLLSEGILIELDIHGESMFACQADWPEFGIQRGEIRSDRMTRGQKHLIDKKRISDLRTVTTQMRQWLTKMTCEITGFKPWAYLNYKRYSEWVEKWGYLHSQFDSVKADILANYDHDLEHLRQDYVEIASRSWQSMAALGYTEILYGGRKFTSQVEFTQHMIAVVMSKVPTVEFIEANLIADYRVSVLQGREQIEEQFIKSEKIKAKAGKIKAKAQADEAKAFAEANILNENLRHMQDMHQLEETEKDVAINAMIKAEAEHIRTQFAETVSPIEEVFKQVRSQMAETCLAAADSVKKNGYVRGKVAEKLRGLVDFYNLISIEDDPKLLKKLQELKAVIGPVAENRNDTTPERVAGEVIDALKGVVQLQNTIREDLKEAPSRFGLAW